MGSFFFTSTRLFRPKKSNFLFMSTKEFYKAVGAKENFLLLDGSEIASFDFEYIKQYLGPPDRILKFNNYQIFVYKKEFASHLPGWF